MVHSAISSARKHGIEPKQGTPNQADGNCFSDNLPLYDVSLHNLRESVQPIIEKGIANAKSHGINVHAGVENLASGDCAIECMIDGISTRGCFTEIYDGTPAFWRNKWFTDMEDLAFAFYDAGMSEGEWRAAWDILKISGQYEYTLGDLILPAIAHCTQKDVLIFNTSPRAHAPIFVIEASTLGHRPANSEIPVLLAYDQSHYESLVPDTEEDIEKTIELKKRFLKGNYQYSIQDIPILNEQVVKQDTISYASVLKNNMDQNKQHQFIPPKIPGLASKVNQRKQVRDYDKECGEGDESENVLILRGKRVKRSQAYCPEKFAQKRSHPKSPTPTNLKNKWDQSKFENRFSCLFEEDSKITDENSQTLEELRKIKNKDRTEAQKNLYKDLIKLQRNEKKRPKMATLRANQSEEEKDNTKAKQHERMAEVRAKQSEEEKNPLRTKSVEE